MTKGKEFDDLNSDDRLTRGLQLGAYARPPKGTPAWERHEARLRQFWDTPEARAHTKEMHQKAVATIRAQQASGAGYPSDSALRELQLEYQNRLTLHGTSYMPVSFSISEAFFGHRKEFAGFVLFPEEDYLISFTDFLDYVTSPDAPALDVGAASSLEQNRIINVNSLDATGDFLLDTDEGHSFSVLGASYVRRGDEISMLMVVGERLPEDEMQKLHKVAREPIIAATNKPDMQLDNSQKREVVYVDADKSLVRDIALCRFNLKERRLEASSQSR